MKIKILFIITHLELGGAQKQLLSLIENLDKDRYSLFLCAGKSGHLSKKFVSIPFLKVYFIPELVRNISPLNDIIAFIKIHSLIRKNRFDIVHTHSPKASILGRWAAYLAGARNIVYTVHGWPFHSFLNLFSYNLYLFLERLTALVTKKIIVVSSADLRAGVKKRVSSRGKFVIIHYGIDTQWADKVFLKRKSSPPYENLIINISCLKPQKGLSYFLDAAKAILREREDARFCIIGDGPLREEVKQEVEKYNLEKYVVLEGWKDDIAIFLARASILALTSLWEGLPLAVIEAVAAGVPVVATDTGGLLDIVKNGDNGVIAKCKDTQSMAGSILAIMDNYKNWHEKVIIARERLDLRYWSDQEMARLTEKAYQETLAL